MVGEDDGISEKTWEVTRLSGIAHLIAISGSHFLLIGGFVFFIVRAALAAFPYVALRWPIKKIAAGAAIAARRPGASVRQCPCRSPKRCGSRTGGPRSQHCS